MKTKHIFIIFIVLAIIQLLLPAQMIFQQESILKTGIAYKFKTQPIDPSNPFKGKYIYLNYDINSIITSDSTWQRKETAYVSIETDKLGFAKATTISKDVPTTGDYVKTKVIWYDSRTQKLNFSLPFNEFYMEESKAYNAELAHIEAQRDSLPNNTYALVYIKNGKTVLDNVFINNIPIATYVEE